MLDTDTVSCIALGELFYGAESSQRRDYHLARIAELRAALPVTDFDGAAAEHYGQIRAALKLKGKPIGTLDPMIAGHARAKGLTLVTRNIRHFQRVSGLRVETWRS
jgi:tRNA(fMet)-specific endonuclease VapC